MTILETGSLASHFTLLGLDGREYSLPASLDGKPALLVFFKTTYATCDLTFPYLNRLRQSHRDGWQLWAISQDTADKARPYATRHGLTYPVLLDAPAFTASRLYDPPATPTLFLVAANGRIDYTTYGFAKDDVNEIERRLAEQLGENSQPLAPENDGNPRFKPG